MAADPRRSSPTLDSSFLAFQEAVAGHYALETELGRGGMGIVYLARDVRLDRSVAIKLLPPNLAKQDKLRDRFLREARTAARLSHPNIVPIHAVDEARRFVFYVMSFIDGETLAQRVAGRGPLPPGEACRVLREVSSALAYAHAQGVVHRDVKPANILIERASGRAMVTDFGIARLSGATGDTATGELLGTPEYMSPEQASGNAVDARSDIYALGVVGFYLVSGTLPFSGSSVQSVLAKQITQPAPPVSSAAAALPRSMALAIDTCLLKNPEQRFQAADALADALAPALVPRAEIPIPVRAFLDTRKMLGLAAASAMGVTSAVVVLSVHLPRMLDLGLTRVLFRSFGAFGLVFGLTIPIILAARWLRPLLRAGYGPLDIATAIRANYDHKREEHLFEHGAAPTRLEKRLTAITWISVAVNMASWTAVAFGTTGDWIWPVVFSSGAVYPITGLLSATSYRARRSAESWWAKRWEGTMGRWLAKLASVKLGRRAAAPDRPTEMAIVFSAQAILDELPKEIRQSLGDVPGVLQRLERHAHEMRQQLRHLDENIADARVIPSSGSRARHDALTADLTAARSKAAQQLADLVSALESMRLDLLRLRAGQLSADSITQNVDTARQLGEDVDHLLSGQAAVDEMLRDASEPTPV